MQDEGPQQVTVRGKSSAVVISVEEYEAMKRQRSRFVDLMRSSPLVGADVAIERSDSLRKCAPELLEDADNGLTPMFRELLCDLWEALRKLDERIAAYDTQIAAVAEQSEVCRRLMTIPGIGPMVSTAMVAAVADGKAFKSGREMAAWLGLVPRQHSTGGRPRLLNISKRGDVYLRMLVIHGARAALRWADKKHDYRSRWVCGLANRRGQNIAAVALANKIVRTAWVLMTREESYRTASATA